MFSGQCIQTNDGRNVRYCCSMCLRRGKTADTEYHLYVNAVKGSNRYGRWICHRCGAKGRNYWEDNPEIQPPAFMGFVEEAALDAVVEFPCQTLPVSRYTPNALSYLLGRGIQEEDIAYYDLRIGVGYYADRVFFPDYNQYGELDYWIARSISGRKPKYLNSTAEKSTRVHYLQRVKESCSTVVITEGPISAVRAGRNGVAVCGKDYSRGQVNLLARADFECYYVAIDGDAADKSRRLVRDLRTKKKTVREVILVGDEDPAELEPEDFLLAVATSAETRLQACLRRVQRLEY